MSRKSTDLSLSVIAALVAIALSWPYWQDYAGPGESVAWWGFYLALGFVLAVYVFHTFLDCLHTLFTHDALDRAAALQRATQSETATGSGASLGENS